METVKLFLYWKSEVCFLLRRLSHLLSKLRQFLAVAEDSSEPFSESLFSKWKDPNFFVFSTSSETVLVHLSDGTVNCLEGH